MILVIVLIIAAVLSFVLIGAVAVSRGLQLPSKSNLAGRIQPIDVEAFRNLINIGDDEFLHARLAARQFRAVRRARLWATASYILQAARNAALLIRIGQEALKNSDYRTQEAAQELINDALLLRRNAVFALLRVYTAMAWPNSGLSAGDIADSYEHLSGSAMLLGRLQDPSTPVRVAAHWG